MSSSVERVGGVEPETVTRLWQHKQSRLLTYIEPVSGLGRRHTADPWREWGDFVPLSALRSVEEELRQAREVAANMKAHYEEALASREMELSRLRWSTCAVADELDRVKLGAKVGDDSTAKAYAQRDDAVRRADAAEADRDRLAEALRFVDADLIADVAFTRRVNTDADVEALRKFAAALSPVQGERRTQPEGESQMDDNNLNHLIGERDAEKWVDGFLTVVPDADRDLMHTWFACAIESGRMTVQGEHEQDGDRWSAANCESCCKLGRPCGVHMRLGGRAQDGDTEETT